MRAVFSDIWFFVYAVITCWQGYAGGLVAVAIRLFERLTKWQLKLRIYVGLFFVLFLLTSFFTVWRDERNGRLQAEADRDTAASAVKAFTERKNPKLNSEFLLVVAGEDHQGLLGTRTLVTLVVAITNVGEVPTIAQNWTCVLELPSGAFNGLPLAVEDNTVLQRADNLPPLILHKADALYNKTMGSAPMQPSQRETGVLLFAFENITPPEIMTRDNRVKLGFADVAGNTYWADYQIQNKPTPACFDIPGLQYQIAVVPLGRRSEAS